MTEVNPDLAFDVSQHEAAKTAPAVSVLKRFREDVAAYAEAANQVPIAKIVRLSDTDIAQYFEGDKAAEETLREAQLGIRQLMSRLQAIKDSDAAMVQDTIPMLERAANWVQREDSNVASKNSKTRFLLSRIAGQNAFIWVEFLFGSLLSSKGEEDMLKLNPYLSADTLDSVLSLVIASMLRANRLGHINRCIGTAIGLDGLLDKVGIESEFDFDFLHFLIFQGFALNLGIKCSCGKEGYDGAYTSSQTNSGRRRPVQDYHYGQVLYDSIDRQRK